MNDIALLYVLFGSSDEAERIGRDMIERRLAACVNLLGPCRSIYSWEGKIEEAEEVAAIFKTSIEGSEALAEAIGKVHSYEVPAIVALAPATTHDPYRRWLLGNVGESQAD